MLGVLINKHRSKEQRFIRKFGPKSRLAHYSPSFPQISITGQRRRLQVEPPSSHFRPACHEQHSPAPPRRPTSHLPSPGLSQKYLLEISGRWHTKLRSRYASPRPQQSPPSWLQCRHAASQSNLVICLSEAVLQVFPICAHGIQLLTKAQTGLGGPCHNFP